MSNYGQENNALAPYDYDAFASYATDPDRDLVRKLEAFIEGFHRRPTLSEAMRRPLELCVDGRDFRIPKRSLASGYNPTAVADIVETYQRRSRALLVLVGPLSKSHPWIEYEVRWWIKHRPDAPIYVGLTHGQSTRLEDFLPPALLDRGGGDLAIFFDLRGYYSQLGWWHSIFVRDEFVRRKELAAARPKKWSSVRGFEEEAAKLSARLLSDAVGNEISLGDIEAAWAADERRLKQRRISIVAAGILGTVGAAAAIGYEVNLAIIAERTAKTESWLQRARILEEQGGAALPTALAYSSSALVERPSASAISITVQALQQLSPVKRILRPDGGEPAWAAALLDDGSKLLVGGRSGILRLVDLTSGSVLARLDLSSSAIRAIVVTKNQQHVFVGTDRGLIKLAVAQREGSYSLIEMGRAFKNSRIGGVAIDRAQNRVFVGLLQASELWSFRDETDALSKGDLVATIMDPRFAENGISDVPSGIYGVDVAGESLVVVGIDGVISTFVLADLSRPPRQITHPNSIFAMAVSHRGTELAIADDNGGVGIYDLATLGLVREDRTLDRSLGVARSLSGLFSVAQPDRLANVGIAISPDDSILAVTSHDRSVRFLTFDGLAPVGSVVHSAAPRTVVFGAGNNEAMTLSDDGAIQIVNPLAQPELQRFGEIDGFAIGPSDSVVMWPAEQRSQPGIATTQEPKEVPIFKTRAVAAATTSIVGTVPDEPWNALVIEPDTIALRSPSSSIVQLRSLSGSNLMCTVLMHRNNPGDVDIVNQILKGPRQGTLATVTESTSEKTIRLHIWDVRNCTEEESWKSVGPVSVNSGAFAIAKTATLIEVHGARPGTPIEARFSSIVKSLSISSEGKMALVGLQEPARVCLCELAEQQSDSSGGQCVAESSGYSCHSLDSALDHGVLPESMAVSQSGLAIVFQHKNAELIGGTRDSSWNLHPLSPTQLRPVTAPFAFSHDEKLVAVPAGETGFQIVDISTGRALANLPTVSRVMKIAFVNAETNVVATLDGGILRMWDWRIGALLKQVCERWNSEAPIFNSPDVARAMPRERLCN
jgi:WD40 repeat protein